MYAVDFLSDYTQKTAEQASPTSVTLHTLQTTLNLPLHPHQIPLLRGAVVEALGKKHDLLHNHKGDEEYHYRYPLVQYRTWRGKAALFGMEEGTTVLRQFLLQTRELKLRQQLVPLSIYHLQEKEYPIYMTDNMRIYRLMDYLPFNQENYEIWQQAANFQERIKLLEGTLVGHIFGFANALPWKLPEHLSLELMLPKNIRPITIHNHRRIAFNLLFKANIALPPGIALGRSVAFGFGVLQTVKRQTVDSGR